MAGSKPFMSVTEVGRLLGVTSERVRQLARAGEVPHVRRGRRIFIPRAAWESWLRKTSEEALASLRGEE